MRQVSTETYNKVMNETAKLSQRLKFTLQSGVNVILTDSDLWSGGVKCEQSVASTTFEIGSAKVDTMTITAINFNGRLDAYDFTNADVQYSVFVDDEEEIKIARGIVQSVPETISSIMNIECYSYMALFDKEVDADGLHDNMTARDLVLYCMGKCGFGSELDHFLNEDTLIKKIPSTESVTYRQILAWVGQLTCNNVITDAEGKLKLTWYSDTNNAVDLTAKKSMTLNKNDVSVTGIRVSEYTVSAFDEEGNDIVPQTAFVGDEGYVFEISSNKLITGDMVEIVAYNIYNRIHQMRFRPFNASIFSNPLYECHDCIRFEDNSGNTIYSYINNNILTLGSNHTVSCVAESGVQKNMKQFSDVENVKTDVKKAIVNASNYIKEATNEMTRLISQGYGMNYGKVTLPNGNEVDAMYDGVDIEHSNYVCYLTSEGIVASLDGGTTWAIDKNGNALMNVLTVNKLTAEQINVQNLFAQEVEAEKLTLTGNSSINLNDKFLVDSQGNMTATSGKIANLDISSAGLISKNAKYGVTYRGVIPDHPEYAVMFVEELDELGGRKALPYYVTGEGFFFAREGKIGDLEFDGYNGEISMYSDNGTQVYGLSKSYFFLGNPSQGLRYDFNKKYLSVDKIHSNNMQSGLTDGVQVSSGSYKDVSVTFAKPFRNTPTITACFYSGSSGVDMGAWNLGIWGMSKTGFNVRVWNNGTVTRDPAISWIAIDTQQE